MTIYKKIKLKIIFWSENNFHLDFLKKKKCSKIIQTADSVWARFEWPSWCKILSHSFSSWPIDEDAEKRPLLVPTDLRNLCKGCWPIAAALQLSKVNSGDQLMLWRNFTVRIYKSFHNFHSHWKWKKHAHVDHTWRTIWRSFNYNDLRSHIKRPTQCIKTLFYLKKKIAGVTLRLERFKTHSTCTSMVTSETIPNSVVILSIKDT